MDDVRSVTPPAQALVAGEDAQKRAPSEARHPQAYRTDGSVLLLPPGQAAAARFRSSSTMMPARSLKRVDGFHPSLLWALLKSPTSCSTSAGRRSSSSTPS